MLEEVKVTYSNDEELEVIWTEGFQAWMDKARSSSETDEEYRLQQEIYSKFSAAYDDAMKVEKYSGYYKISQKINSLFEKEKDINILDFGCGTGLVADELSKYGFRNVDGTDCNEALIEVARKKNIMKNYYIGKSTGAIEKLPSDKYDVVCASGVFFLTRTHPGTDMFPELCRIIRPGGYLIILTKNAYLDLDYVDHSIIKELEEKNVLKCLPKETYEGYRMTFEFEEDRKSLAAILSYQIL